MLPNLQFPADLVAFTEEIVNGKLHILCSVIFNNIRCSKSAVGVQMCLLNLNFVGNNSKSEPKNI